ncbi:MAG: hypothetical protein GY768_25510, partial [Planctomycetaceae bacterium]|nr:hypothetical protein [Planctomycetaceae bacterium]
RYKSWRNAFRAAVALGAQFCDGEVGCESAYPPSDRVLLEQLEELWRKYHLGYALKPEVYRAAIAITAKEARSDPVFPEDRFAVECDVSYAKHGHLSATQRALGRTATNIEDAWPVSEVTEMVGGFKRDELLELDPFAAPPTLPLHDQLRSTVLFWGGDETSMIYRKTKGKRSEPTVDMEYVARWPFLRTSIGHSFSHEMWRTGIQVFINTYRHMLEEVGDVSGRTAADTPVMRLPSNFCCAIYSNLAWCYNPKGA